MPGRAVPTIVLGHMPLRPLAIAADVPGLGHAPQASAFTARLRRQTLPQRTALPQAPAPVAWLWPQ
eukprot:8038332-Lingulodinium_polyedra.AAC.1